MEEQLASILNSRIASKAIPLLGQDGLVIVGNIALANWAVINHVNATLAYGSAGFGTAIYFILTLIRLRR
jgi:hypothetical protein